MPIAAIANGEGGASVRTKMNDAIAEANKVPAAVSTITALGGRVTDAEGDIDATAASLVSEVADRKAVAERAPTVTMTGIAIAVAVGAPGGGTAPILATDGRLVQTKPDGSVERVLLRSETQAITDLATSGNLVPMSGLIGGERPLEITVDANGRVVRALTHEGSLFIQGPSGLRAVAMADATLSQALIDEAIAPFKAPGNGLLVRNGEQMVGRSLIPGRGVVIKNADGIDGDLIISAAPGRIQLGAATVDLNTTGDQRIPIPEFGRYVITEILVTNRQGTLNAPVGGVYSWIAKGGFVLVAATQGYSGLTDDKAVVFCALSAAAARTLSGSDIFFSLTTANGAACTADVHVFGFWLPEI